MRESSGRSTVGATALQQQCLRDLTAHGVLLRLCCAVNNQPQEGSESRLGKGAINGRIHGRTALYLHTCSSRRMYWVRSTSPCLPSRPSCCSAAAAAAGGTALPLPPLWGACCRLLVMPWPSSLSLGRFAVESSRVSSLRPAPLIPSGGTSPAAGRGGCHGVVV